MAVSPEVSPSVQHVLLNTEFGPQYILVDRRDALFVRFSRATYEGRRLNIVVQRFNGPSRARLQQVIAERHLKKPSPAHKYVGFRNGWYNDFRAENLYWSTRAQNQASGNNVAFRQDRAEELRRAEKARRAQGKAGVAAEQSADVL